MISHTEKIVAIVWIAIPALLVLLTKGRRSPEAPWVIAVFYAAIDWRFVRRVFFRTDDTWRPLAKGLLLALFVVALICVWIA